MIRPILDPSYWTMRLARANKSNRPHEAVFRCSEFTWRAIEDRHRQILEENISPTDSILDAGCGWGRLLTLLPQTWNGQYVGIDICPAFVDLANRLNPEKTFIVGDLSDIILNRNQDFDWAIMISIRPMIIRELGEIYWRQVEHNLRFQARKLLFLEYKEDDEGSIE